MCITLDYIAQGRYVRDHVGLNKQVIEGWQFLRDQIRKHKGKILTSKGKTFTVVEIILVGNHPTCLDRNAFSTNTDSCK